MRSASGPGHLRRHHSPHGKLTQSIPSRTLGGLSRCRVPPRQCTGGVSAWTRLDPGSSGGALVGCRWLRAGRWLDAPHDDDCLADCKSDGRMLARRRYRCAHNHRCLVARSARAVVSSGARLCHRRGARRAGRSPRNGPVGVRVARVLHVRMFDGARAATPLRRRPPPPLVNLG